MSPSSPKSKRRKRDDNFNRDFICGCGKGYLSYPALYTHLKQKHQGQTPEGTLTPLIQQPVVKQEVGQAQIVEIKEEVMDSLSSCDEENQLKLGECMEELWALLFIIQNKLKQKGEKVVFVQTILNCDVDPLRQFPSTYFKYQDDIWMIMNEIKLNIEQNNQLNQMNTDKTKKVKTCVQVIAEYLYEASKSLTYDCYSELCVFMTALNYTFDQIGNQYLIPNQKNPKDPNILPYIVNKFIVQHFQDFFRQRVETQNFKLIGQVIILGIEQKNMTFQVYLIFHFCHWLNVNRYSEYNLIYDEYFEQN